MNFVMSMTLQMSDIKERLFRHDAGDDAWQAFVSLLRQLVSKHHGSSEWGLNCIPPLPGGSRAAQAMSSEDLASSAYEIEQLLIEPLATQDQPLIFLKTFNEEKMLKKSTAASILRELRLCSLEQPAFRHDGVCRISLATHAAAIETEFTGYGRVGLRARLPFVALEYCEGMDLFDFAHPNLGLPAIMRGLKGSVHSFLKCPDVATDPCSVALGSIPGISSKENSLLVIDILQALSTNQEEILSLIVDFHAILKKDAEVAENLQQRSGEASVPSLTETSGIDVKALIQALAAKFEYDVIGEDSIGQSKRSRSIKQLHEKVKAARAFQQLCQHLNDWDWPSVAQFLSYDRFKCFLPGGLTLAESNVQDKLLRLAQIASKERESAARLSARLGQLLLGDRLCLKAIFHPKQKTSYRERYEAGEKNESDKDLPVDIKALQLEDALLQHLYTTPGKGRSKAGKAAAAGEISCPADVAWSIFHQAAEAVAELHSCSIAHCDIKVENFVLTVEGRTKLVDFGFLMDLQRLDPIPSEFEFPGFNYSSPEFRQLAGKKFTLSQLVAHTKLTPAELFKANDVWMLGQTLFYLLTRQTRSTMFYANTYVCDGLHGWESMTPDEQSARSMIDGLGLPLGQAQALKTLLFDQVLVPVQRRVLDASALLEAIEKLDPEFQWAAAGQAELLGLLWPYHAPSPDLPAKGSKGRGKTAGVAFEADVEFVKVRRARQGA
jgi:hypothetical protein